MRLFAPEKTPEIFLRGFFLIVAVASALFLGACAGTEKMTVGGKAETAPPKLRNAFSVGTVEGACNISNAGLKLPFCVEPPIPPHQIKEALERSLAANGLLASGHPMYVIDVNIEELRLPLIALDTEVTASVAYKVTGGNNVRTYPIKSAGTAQLVEMPIAAMRGQYAMMYALRQNFSQFIEALKR